MNLRRNTSRGQAIVMVTVALIAMAGMMGLAVDLGWSFFVQRAAQAAADSAALGAAQEAMSRLGAGGFAPSSFVCGGASAGVSGSTVECHPATISCASVAAQSNLHNGCAYALVNGFDPANARQTVTIQSNDGQTANLPPTAPGVKRLAYWVSVRVTQTIPQLFSSVLGNTQGTVSAMATAAIVGSITPGSFYGMNRAGDCPTGGASGNCGVDATTGHGKGKGKGGSQACGPNALTSDLCAPAGFVFASSCNSSSDPGCDGEAADENGAAAIGASLLIMGPNGQVSGTWHDLSGANLLPSLVHSTDPASFRDPTAPNPQPPLQASSAITACGLTGGTVPANSTLGPYQYYAKNAAGVPTGAAITLGDNVTFDPTASGNSSCPGGTLTSGFSQGSSFPTFIFWGGLNTGGSATFKKGQYVMAGVNTNANDATVFSAGGTVTGDATTGTMFIFTDGNYPGLTTQKALIPNIGSMPTLYQGTIGMSGDITLSGLINNILPGSTLPSAMNVYSGVVWWQDRRNSVVGYNQTAGPDCTTAGVACTGDDGSVISCAIGCAYGNSTTPNLLKTVNHVTATSPGITFPNGSTKVALTGVWYQPRGGWLDFGNGNTGINCPATSGQCPLQVVTGAVIMGNGNTRMVLAGPTNPLITYKASLIQ